MDGGRWLRYVCAAVLSGCTQSSPRPPGSFATGETNQTDGGQTDDTTTGGFGDGAISASAGPQTSTDEGEMSSPGTDTSTSGSNTSSTSTAGESTNESSTSDGSGSSSTGESPPLPGQPAEGMWAHCLADFFDNCTSDAAICVNIETPELGQDGFCTDEGCVDPAVDCDPVPPDSDAVSICAVAQDADANPSSLCAIDCSGGGTCPQGMVCVENLSFGEGLPAYDFCM